MLIEVKAEHIKDGTRGNCSLCPIALALLDAGFTYPYVATDYLSIQDGDQFVECAVPRSANRFIDKFDQKKPVKPFRFRLETA